MNYAQNKGITLIALIITIIVMLILAGVTINIIVNGGLFEQAREAAELTKLRAVEEKAEMLTAEYAMWKETTKSNDKSVGAFLKGKADKGEGTYNQDTGFYTDSEGTVFAKSSDNRIVSVQTGSEDTFDLPIALYTGGGGAYAIAEVYHPDSGERITAIKCMWRSSGTPLSKNDSAWASAYDNGVGPTYTMLISSYLEYPPSGTTYLHLLVTLEGGETHVLVKGPIQITGPTT